MGQDFAVWAYRDSLDGNQIVEEFRSIADSDFSGIPKVPHAIRHFVNELDERWPQLAQLSEDSISQSPWSSDHWVSDAHAWLHTLLSHNSLGSALADAVELAAANRLVLFDPQLCIGYCPNGKKLRAPLPEQPGQVEVVGGDSDAACELQTKLARVFNDPPPTLKRLLNLHRQATLLGRGELGADEAQELFQALKDPSEPDSKS